MAELIPTPFLKNWQACITAAIAKDQRDEGPCPQCKKTVKLSDLVHVGGAPCYGGGSSSSSGGGASPGVNPELHAAGSGETSWLELQSEYWS